MPDIARLQELAVVIWSRSERSSGGVVGLMDVTDADREMLAASDRLAAVRGEESRAAVAAYRALGGGWHADQKMALASMRPEHM